MKKKFPLNDINIPDFANEECSSSGNPMNTPLGRAMMINLMNYMKPEEERVAPDKRGCEIIFARAFATQEMYEDFPLIARDFLKHEIINIEAYKDLSYENDMPMYSDMDEFWKRTIVYYMFTGFKEGSAYCKALLQYLFKTYYKDMYKILKKFRVIGFDDILSLAEADEDNLDCYMIAVILCIADVFDINKKENCDALYLMLNEKSKEQETYSDTEFLEFPDGLFEECKKQIDEILAMDYRKVLKKKYRSEKFEYNCLRYFGYPEEFIILYKESSGGIRMELAKTLAILKLTYPKKEFTADEILNYSNLFDAVSAMANSANQVYDNWIDILNLGDDAFYEENGAYFDPSKIEVRGETAKKESISLSMQVEKPKETKLEKDNHYSEAALLSEIEALRKQVHIAEKEKRTLRHELQEAKRSIRQQEILEQEVNDCKDELTALRSHLYHFTEYDEPAEAATIDKMVNALKKKKVTIVGGHINWVQKMKKTFPDWNFITPNVSVLNDSRQITGADYVYFFTDTLSHSVYNTFIQVVRENGVAFGYIHGVNIEANVKQMWEDVCECGL